MDTTHRIAFFLWLLLLVLSGCSPLNRNMNHLRSDDPQTRIQAAETLGKLGNPEAVPPLSSALGDADWRVRQVAALALGEMGTDQAVLPLVDSLHDPHPSVREAAAEALGQLSDQRSCRALVDRLADEDARVVDSASDALLKIGEPAVHPMLVALETPAGKARERIVSLLGQIGDSRAVPSLVRLLEDENAGVRAMAAEALHSLGWSPDRTDDLVAYYLARQDWPALKRLGKRPIEALLLRLHDDSSEVRRNAILLLAEIEDKRCVGPLVECLSDSSPEIRTLACETLARIGEPSVGPLVSALEDQHLFVRTGAAIALSKIGSPAVPPLIEMLASTGETYRTEAVRILVNIGAPAVEALIGALDHEDGEIRREAANALGGIGIECVRNVVESWLPAAGAGSQLGDACTVLYVPLGDGALLPDSWPATGDGPRLMTMGGRDDLSVLRPAAIILGEFETEWSLTNWQAITFHCLGGSSHAGPVGLNWCGQQYSGFRRAMPVNQERKIEFKSHWQDVPPLQILE